MDFKKCTDRKLSSDSQRVSGSVCSETNKPHLFYVRFRNLCFSCVKIRLKYEGNLIKKKIWHCV